MTDDRPDNLDDLPVLTPLPAADVEPAARRPGFGFWMAGVWCLVYLILSQIVVGGFVGVVGFFIVSSKLQNERGGGLGPEQAAAILASPEMAAWNVAATISAHAAGILFALLMLRINAGRSWYRKIALIRRPTITHVALVVIGFPALLAIVVVLEEWVNAHVPGIRDLFGIAGVSEAIAGLVGHPLPLVLFTIAVMPGIGEELWCRGFLGRALSARYGVLWAAVISSFYFGLIHVEPPQAIMAAFIGVFLYLAYAATRSMLVPILMHFTNNALGVIHMKEDLNFPVLQPLEDAHARSPWLLLAGGLCLLSAVGYALYQTRCRLVPSTPGMPSWEPAGKGGVDLPPKKSGTIVDHDPLTPLSTGLVVVGAIIFGLMIAFG